METKQINQYYFLTKYKLGNLFIALLYEKSTTPLKMLKQTPWQIPLKNKAGLITKLNLFRLDINTKRYKAKIRTNLGVLQIHFYLSIHTHVHIVEWQQKNGPHTGSIEKRREPLTIRSETCNPYICFTYIWHLPKYLRW